MLMVTATGVRGRDIRFGLTMAWVAFLQVFLFTPIELCLKLSLE